MSTPARFLLGHGRGLASFVLGSFILVHETLLNRPPDTDLLGIAALLILGPAAIHADRYRSSRSDSSQQSDSGGSSSS